MTEKQAKIETKKPAKEKTEDPEETKKEEEETKEPAEEEAKEKTPEEAEKAEAEEKEKPAEKEEEEAKPQTGRVMLASPWRQSTTWLWVLLLVTVAYFAAVLIFLLPLLLAISGRSGG